MKRYRGDLKLELVRKAVHILSGVIIVLGVQGGIISPLLLGIIILFLGAAIFYNLQAERELLTKILSINRADARIPGLDVLFYFIGCWLVLVTFDRTIAFASILILAFGDSIAHLFSVRFGATQTFLTRTTYLEGTIAGIIAATLAAWLYVPLLAALVASAFAMIVEAGELHISNHHVDDNLTIPIVAAVTLWIISLAFPFV